MNRLVPTVLILLAGCGGASPAAPTRPPEPPQDDSASPEVAPVSGITGSVRGPGGFPVQGATVVVAGAGQLDVAGTAVSGEGGAFSVNVSPGDYVVSATKDGFAAASSEVTVARDGRAAATVELGARGLRLEGFVQVLGGGVPEGARVWLADRQGSTRVVALADERGSYALDVAEGIYDVMATGQGIVGLPGVVEVRKPATVDVPVVLETRLGEAPGDEVREWLAARAWPWGALAGRRLEAFLGDADVVAVGHSPLRAELTRRLLDADFRVVVLDVPLAEALDLDAFARGAQAELPGDTDPEVAALVEGIRVRNRKGRAPIRVVGMAPGGTSAAAEGLVTFLQSVDAELAENAAPGLGLFGSTDAASYRGLSPQARRLIRSTLDGVLRAFEDRQDAWRKKAGADAALARRLAVALAQTEAVYAGGEALALGQRFRAETVKWAAEELGRTVVWTDAGSLARKTSGAETMGTHLGRMFRSAYVGLAAGALSEALPPGPGVVDLRVRDGDPPPPPWLVHPRRVPWSAHPQAVTGSLDALLVP